MADPNQSDVFKFVALRPPVSIDKVQQKISYISDERKPEQTPVGELAAKFDKKDGSKIPSQLREFIKANAYDLSYPQSKGDETLSRTYEYAKHAPDDLSNDSLKKGIEKIIGKKLQDFLNDEKTHHILNGIWDRYYAFFILTRSEPQNLENLTNNLRTFHLLSVINNNTANINSRALLQDVLTATVTVPKLFTDLPKPLVEAKIVKEDKPNQANIKKYKEIWNNFLTAHQAINEIRNLTTEKKLTTETQKIKVADKESGREIETNITFLKHEPEVKASALDQLHADSKAVLKKLNIKETSIQGPSTIEKLNTNLTQVYSLMRAINDPQFLEAMPDEAKLLPGVAPIMSMATSGAKYKPLLPNLQYLSARALIKPLGVGDLKVVKQKLKKYVTGEVAHIENVLKGESKDRKHRVLDRTEDIFTVSTETEEETTKDTQTTERFELKKESEKTIQEQMSVQAGVTVSGSYGVVTFGAHGDFAYSTSSQESSKNSSNFAREVVDKSVSKIQKRVKEERTTKNLHEVEEINEHGLNNVGGADHITGIYRWVDKHYEAQIYNYGVRMMFEFIIPEPAAFFEYAQLNKPKKNIVAPPAFTLTHQDITESTYQTYISDYNVQGVTPPPSETKVISLSLEQSGVQNGQTISKSSKELVVPEGYVASNLGFSLSVIYENYPQFRLSIGNDAGWAVISNDQARRKWDYATIGFPFGYDGIIPIALHGYDVNSYFVNISVTCNRTQAKYEQWQIQTFEKIMTAYKAMQAEYEQKVAAQETETGVAIHGQNPGINRDIEKTELKKHCVKMLMDTYLYSSFDAMKQQPGSPPDFDIFDAIDEGKTIQFFEQAFEWENITYLYYPYFWGRKSEWLQKSTTYDEDPLFTKFLQAGSARVVIPVHPAYRDAILYYLETGALWNGGDSPRLNDPLFISIHEELKNQTDDLANATPEGDPWEVILPTTLVYLQKDSDLPSF